MSFKEVKEAETVECERLTGYRGDDPYWCNVEGVNGGHIDGGVSDISISGDVSDRAEVHGDELSFEMSESTGCSIEEGRLSCYSHRRV